ncbi:MAG: potassium channel protein [Bacillota bacterium]
MSGSRVRRYVLLLVAVYAVAVTGYMLVEGLSLLDSLYFTVATMTTLGYGDIVPRSVAGRLLTIVLAPAGLVVVFGIGMSMVGDFFRLMYMGVFETPTRRLHRVQNHFVVCGYGKVGSPLAAHLKKMGQQVVVIEMNEERAKCVVEDGHMVVVGDALKDSTLKRAGIDKARALITTFSEDTDNVYLILEALDLRKDLEVISTATNRVAARRLYLAGAKRVVSPNLVGAEMLAKSAVNPSVMQLMSELTDASEVEEKINQVPVADGSALVGKTLRDLSSLGLSVKVVLIKKGGYMRVSPGGDHQIEAGSVLVVAGTGPEIEKIERLAQADRRQ